MTKVKKTNWTEAGFCIQLDLQEISMNPQALKELKSIHDRLSEFVIHKLDLSDSRIIDELNAIRFLVEDILFSVEDGA